jgi:hypothetical protein
VTGWYKAFARKHLLVFGLLAAVLFNIDTIAITKQIAAEPGLRSILVGYSINPEFQKLSQTDLSADPGKASPSALAAGKEAKQFLEQAHGLPFGWSRTPLEWWNAGTMWTRLFTIFGWLLTGLGVSLGAPFWFDLLNKVASLRASGPKPPLVEETKA